MEDFEKASRIKQRVDEAEAELVGITERREGVVSVTAGDIADVVSRRTGIPASRLTASEKDRLLRLEEVTHERIVGQDEAVTAVSQAVRRNRAGMGDPNRPVGSFLFLGPTGVGRTELAKTLAELLFGEEQRMIRFDMSRTRRHRRRRRRQGHPSLHRPPPRAERRDGSGRDGRAARLLTVRRQVSSLGSPSESTVTVDGPSGAS